MTALTPFTYAGRQVRVVAIDGNPWFVAADIARPLGYRDAATATRTVRAVEKGTHLVCTPGGDQRVSVISESGLYRLIMRSDRPEADTFQDWVVAEVLPAIRRTGSYGQVRELTRLELINIARDAELGRLDAERRVAELEPAAHSWEQLAQAAGDYSLREAAQNLDRDPAISTGQNRLARTLREIGWADRNGIPYQRQVDLGRLVQRAVTFEHPRTGEDTLTTQLRVTAKGLHELHRLLGGERPLLLTAPAEAVSA